MQKKRVILSGLATVDYVVAADTPLTAPGTVNAALAMNEPRPGGAPLYAAAMLGAHGHDAWPLATIGADAHGALYRKACDAAGIRTEGLAVTRNAKTPACIMIYTPDGSCQCLLDASAAAQPLVALQKKLLAEADLIVIAAASAETTQDILAHAAPAQRLAWIVKHDSACFPPDLCRRLSERADYVFCNAAERDLVANGPAHRLLVETRGRDGAFVTAKDFSGLVPARPLTAIDTTGAGDTLAGEILAQILNGETDLSAAVAHGIAAAQALLVRRGSPE